MKNLTTKLTVLVALIVFTFTSCKKEVEKEGKIEDLTDGWNVISSRNKDSKAVFYFDIALRSMHIKNQTLKSFDIYTLNTEGKKVLFAGYSNISPENSSEAGVSIKAKFYRTTYYNVTYSLPLEEAGLSTSKKQVFYIVITGENGVVFNKELFTTEIESGIVPAF